MTKPIRILLAVILAAVLALTAGCSGGGGGTAADPAGNPASTSDGDGKAAANPGDTFVGSWKLTGMIENGEEMDAEMLALLEGMGAAFQVIFEEDGAFKLEMVDESMEGTWEAKDANTVEASVAGEILTGTLDGVKLTFEQDGNQMIFEKKEG